jgi:1,4-dihydroxy-2-naphthoate octaprenyltransferase
MTSHEPLGAAEPSLAALAGDTLAARARRLLLATRPAFAPASVAPVLIGTAWGYRASGHMHWTVALLALFATLLVHLGANVLNDVADDLGGTDRINQERIFPYTGGSRFIQNGIMSANEMTVWGVTLLAAAALLGLALIELRGPAILVFGLIGVALGVSYSLPRIQLAARGIGEAAIAIAFGVLPVTGAAWLQSGRLDGASVVISVPVSLWVAAILLMNEVPDQAADARAGKATLVVRLGTEATRRVYLGLQLTACAAFLLAGALRLVPWWIAIVSIALIPGAWSAAQGIREPAERARLTRSIRTTLALHTAGSVLLLAAVLLAAFLR